MEWDLLVRRMKNPLSLFDRRSIINIKNQEKACFKIWQRLNQKKLNIN